MQIVVFANASQKDELTSGLSAVAKVVFINDESKFLLHPEADAFIDLQFTNSRSRIALLAQLLPKPVVINSVVDTLEETNEAFVRINGWNTFLSSAFLEAACRHEETRSRAAEVFMCFGKQLQWLNDEPGFITARVVSMIVNEAFVALSEGVSTKDEINTAMKLGTAYPYGPFEWAEKIGSTNIAALLQKLSESQVRYAPSPLLVQTAANP